MEIMINEATLETLTSKRAVLAKFPPTAIRQNCSEQASYCHLVGKTACYFFTVN